MFSSTVVNYEEKIIFISTRDVENAIYLPLSFYSSVRDRMN